MSVVELRIVEPAHGAVLLAPPSVRLRGEVRSTGHRPLFFKWYSSNYVATGIASPADAPKAALNFGAGSTLDFTFALKVGTHEISLAAKDVASEDPTALRGLVDAGMAGGPARPGVAAPCVVHVLAANLVSPAAGSVARASLVLKAEAPARWPDAGYDALRVGYSFTFTPTGAPAGRSVVTLSPVAADLVFENAAGALPPVVRWNKPLPPALVTGGYQLKLRVFDKNNPAAGHEATAAITIT